MAVLILGYTMGYTMGYMCVTLETGKVEEAQAECFHLSSMIKQSKPSQIYKQVGQALDLSSRAEVTA